MSIKEDLKRAEDLAWGFEIPRNCQEIAGHHGMEVRFLSLPEPVMSWRDPELSLRALINRSLTPQEKNFAIACEMVRHRFFPADTMVLLRRPETEIEGEIRAIAAHVLVPLDRLKEVTGRLDVEEMVRLFAAPPEVILQQSKMLRLAELERLAPSL